jgi:hypothetical protein
VTLVKRLKAAPPHFVGHVKAPAPNIIMRRLATSERTVTPTPGIMSRTIKSSFIGVHDRLFNTALAELRNAASFARRALPCARFVASRFLRERLTLPRN